MSVSEPIDEPRSQRAPAPQVRARDAAPDSTRKGRWRRAILFPLILLSVSTLVTLLGIEVVLRLFHPQQLIQLRPDIWQPVDGVGHQYAPNLETTINTGERSVTLLTDENCNRIGRTPPPAGARRILVLGDSFTTALQVEFEDTFAHLIAEGLSAELREPVYLVNTGVSGWDPNHYRIKLLQEVGSGDYEHAVIFFFLGNDIVRKRRETFAPRPSSYHPLRLPRSLALDEITNAVLYPINDALETRSHTFVFFKRHGQFVLRRVGIAPTFFPSTVLRSQQDSKRWTVSADLCAEAAEIGRAAGVGVSFVLLPADVMIDSERMDRYAGSLGIAPENVDPDQPARLVRREFEARGLQFIDLSEPFAAAVAAGTPDVYGTVDNHFGPAGHRIVAAEVTPWLADVLAAAPDRSTSSPAVSSVVRP